MNKYLSGNKTFLKKASSLSLIGLLGFILYANLFLHFNNCLNAYDLGLYYQAMVNMAVGDLNPYLTVRTLHIFNDHFEPALLLASPSVWLAGFSAAGPLIFEWVTLVFFIWSLYYLNGRKYLIETTFFVLFSRGLLTAYVFPIHPNTWSLIIWPFLISALKREKNSQVILLAFTLLLFRESYVFALPGVFLFFLIERNRKMAMASFFMVVAGFLIIFPLRKLIFGPSYDYGGVFIKGLLNEHIFFIFKQIAQVETKAFLKVFIPFLIPALFALKKDPKCIKEKAPRLILFMIGPVFFLHILAGKIHYHYGITFVAPLLSLFLLSSTFKDFLKNKKVVLLSGFVFFFTATSTYTKWVKRTVFMKNDQCVISAKKRADTLDFIKFFEKEIPLEATIFSSGRIVPRIMAPKIKIYVPSHFVVDLPQYDYLLLEKNIDGEFRSFNQNRYQKVKSLCETEGTKVIKDDQHFYLLKGPILPQCYNHISSFM